MTASSPLPSRRQIRLVLLSLVVAVFMSSLNQTVIGTAMKTIADDLGGLSLQAWVTTAFLIAMTVGTPIYGKLSDVFGRRPLLLVAMGIFALGTVLSSFAGDMIQLAAFRAVQGLGAGGLMSLPLAILGDVLSPRERAKYQGMFMAVFGVSAVAGPLIGGLFAGIDTLLGIEGWRWVFLFNLPLTALAAWLAWRFLRLPRAHGRARIDWAGSVLVVLIVVPLILVAEQGAHWGWTSTPSIVSYAIVAVSLVAFIVVERRMGEDGLIPLHLFSSPSFSITVGLSVLVGFGMFSAMTTLPLYMQVVQQLSPTTAGLALLPQIGAQLLASLVMGFVLSRIGRTKWVVVVGVAVMLASFVLLSTMRYDDPTWRLFLPMALFGASLGALLQALTLTLQSAVEPRDLGVATAASAFFRQIGGTLGTGITFSMLFGTLLQTIPQGLAQPAIARDVSAAVADRAVQGAPANARILELVQGPAERAALALNGDTSFLQGADDRLVAPFLWAFNESMTLAYWFGVAVLVAALLLSLFLPDRPLGEKSALQELHDRGEIVPPAEAGSAPTGPIGTIFEAERAERRRKGLPTGPIDLPGGEVPRPGGAVDRGAERGAGGSVDEAAERGAGRADARGADAPRERPGEQPADPPAERPGADAQPPHRE